MKTTHVEGDLIMVQRANQNALHHGTSTVTGEDHILINAVNTMVENVGIVSDLLATDALSGYDMVAPNLGLAKITAVKKLTEGAQLNSVGNNSAEIAMAIEQSTLFISDCYGFRLTSMTDCRIHSWIQKMSRARKIAPPLKNLPPTEETLVENVK